MKYLAITIQGFEDICAKELKELEASRTTVNKGSVIFETTVKNIKKIIELGQSFSKIIKIWQTNSYKDIADLDRIKDGKINIKANQTFRVRSEITNSTIKSNKLEPKVGEIIYNYLKSNKLNPKVSMNDPDIKVLIHLNDKEYYLGEDLIEDTLDKRSYRLIAHPASFKGTILYCLLRFSGFKPGQKLLDPNCRDGILAIEAARFCINKGKHKAISKILATDPFKRNILNSKKNAAVAGIDLNYNQVDFDWLETRYEEDYFDIIATALPSPTKFNQKIVEKDYRALLESLQSILKKGGDFAAIISKPELFKKLTIGKFKITKEKEFYSGKQRYYALLMVKL